jgi:hypothetical protein
VGGGSGWVAETPVDSLDQCGHFGGGLKVVVAVLAELWLFF